MISKELTDSIKNATIDELMGKLEYCGHDGYYNELYYPVTKEIKRRLKEPKEQPEIIRCKDCKWYELPSHKITENCVRWMKRNSILLPIKPNDYCSYAEKREEGDE